MGAPVRYAVIPPEGPVRIEEQVLDYDALTGIVGFPLEVVSVGTGTATMYVSEEAKQRHAAPNPRASALARLRNGDVIAGTALVCGPADNFGDDTSLPKVVEDLVMSGAA